MEVCTSILLRVKYRPRNSEITIRTEHLYIVVGERDHTLPRPRLIIDIHEYETPHIEVCIVMVITLKITRIVVKR